MAPATHHPRTYTKNSAATAVDIASTEKLSSRRSLRVSAVVPAMATAKDAPAMVPMVGKADLKVRKAKVTENATRRKANEPTQLFCRQIFLVPQRLPTIQAAGPANASTNNPTSTATIGASKQTPSKVNAKTLALLIRLCSRGRAMRRKKIEFMSQ